MGDDVQPLTVRGGSRGTRVLHTAARYTVGRGDDADIHLPDRQVSRTHGYVEHRSGRWWYVDASSGGTFDPHGTRLREDVAVDPSARLRLGDPDRGPWLELTTAAESSETPHHDRRAAVVSDADPGPGADPVPGADPGEADAAGHARTPLGGGSPSTGPDPQSSSVRTVGRGTDCDVVVDDLLASRHHAELHRVDGRWMIVDVGSANGTFVDGARVSEAILRDGARVTVASKRFRFDDGDLVAEDRPALTAEGLSVVTDDGVTILADVTMTAGAGTLSAVVGPTGAGKSTLLRALSGAQPPSAGTVTVGGRDLYGFYDEVHLQLGHVPQEDIVHQQLTARQALHYGAELRLPDETSVGERQHLVEGVLDALGMTTHADKPVSQLSGGQRKRVNVALELLTEPAVLFLDEPTSGLDPGYEQAIMRLLRQLADEGRTVVVVTHSVASLDLCDQVIFLGTGGWVAFAGAASDAVSHFGVADHPAVFRRLEQWDPGVGAARHPVVPAEPAGGGTPPPLPSTAPRQLWTLIRRSVAILVADRRALAVLAMAAVVPAALILALIDPGALDADRDGPSPGARTLLTGIVVTVGVIGAANGLREIVKESAIYRRERAAGLRRSAYLTSKVVVFGALSAVQATIVVVIATARAAGPATGNLLPGRLELVGGAALAAVVALLVGLCISAIVSSSEKAMALIPVVFVVMWLFSGANTDLADRPVLREVALASPSNWGMAAAASTSDLLGLERCGDPPAATGTAASPPAGGSRDRSGDGGDPPPGQAPGGPTEPAPAEPAPPTGTEGGSPPQHCDRRWEAGFVPWSGSIVALVVLGALAYMGTDWALARREPLPHLRRQHLARRLTQRARRRLHGATTRHAGPG